jgi:hypothetical protein
VTGNRSPSCALRTTGGGCQPTAGSRRRASPRSRNTGDADLEVLRLAVVELQPDGDVRLLQRAQCTARSGAQRRPGPQRGQNARRHGVPRQPYARSRPALERTPGALLGARARSRHAGAASVGTPSPSAPPVGWSLTEPSDARASRPYETRLQGAGRRWRVDAIIRRLVVEVNVSGCANRASLPTALAPGACVRAWGYA